MVDVSGSFFLSGACKDGTFPVLPLRERHFQAHKHKKHKQHEWQQDEATQ